MAIQQALIFAQANEEKTESADKHKIIVNPWEK